MFHRQVQGTWYLLGVCGGVHTERAAPTKLCILQPDQGQGLDMGSEGT